MTKEEKKELIIAICQYLPYGVWVEFGDGMSAKLKNINLLHYYNNTNTVQELDGSTDLFGDEICVNLEHVHPFLRSMSDMTEEEREEYKHCQTNYEFAYFDNACSIDWLNAHHFDYRGLIEKGLALKAPKDMYGYSDNTTENE